VERNSDYMNVKAGLKLRKVGATYMLVDVSISHPNMTDVYTLNETAAMVWTILSEGVTDSDKIAARICQEYDIDYDTSARDVKTIIESWINSGLIAG